MARRPPKVLFESDYIKVVKHGSNGRKDPSGMVINVWRPEHDEWRGMKVTLDDLFDLAEALDDICDDIEDEMDERGEH